jgi:hypothetical protein
LRPPVSVMRCTTSNANPSPQRSMSLVPRPDFLRPAPRICPSASRFWLLPPPNLAVNSQILAVSSPNLTEHREQHGCLVYEVLSLIVIDNLAHLRRFALPFGSNRIRAPIQVQGRSSGAHRCRAATWRRAFRHTALPGGDGESEARYSPGSVPQDARSPAPAESCHPKNSQP